MKRIVIDTNIVVSAAIGNGYSKRILKKIIFDDTIDICISTEIVKEYDRVSNYLRIQKKYPLFKEEMDDMILSLKEIARVYFPTQSFSILKDISDNIYLDLAHEAKAHYIITGNKNDFSIAQFEQTKIVSPKEFCELYETNNL
jgi:putative PIN family toxin of toxin-antitoxin system